MSEAASIDANFICQIARANGLNLTPERAEALLPVVRSLLTVDAQITQLNLDKLSAVGLPWEPGELDDEQ